MKSLLMQLNENGSLLLKYTFLHMESHALRSFWITPPKWSALWTRFLCIVMNVASEYRAFDLNKQLVFEWVDI